MPDIVRAAPTSEDRAFILGMWILYLLAPTEPNPDIDGFFDLGKDRYK